MDLFRLNQFYYVAKEKNLTRAALKLNISKPALSRSISYFEQSLKRKLFVRAPKGMIPTPEGERLFEHAQHLIHQAQSFEKMYQENEDEMQGEIKIITTPFLGTEWLVPTLKEFLTLFPKIRINICHKIDSINPIEADVVISPFIPSRLDLVQQELFTVKMGLYASPEYLDSYGFPQTVEELDEHKLIVFKKGYYHWLGSNSDWILSLGNCKEKYYREPYFELDSWHGVLNCAFQGYGIAELHDFSFILNSSLQRVLPDTHGPEIQIYYIYPKFKYKSKKLNTLCEYLKKRPK